MRAIAVRTRGIRRDAIHLDPAWRRRLEAALLEIPARVPRGFRPEVIVLARGARATPLRARRVERILAAFPGIAVREREDLSHMEAARQGCRGSLPALERARRARRTLVLGAMGRLEKPGAERGVLCPGYRSLSLTASCWYGCAYCYLAGTIASSVSPAVKIFLNIEDALAAIERRLRRSPAVRGWYIGKLQDALALDPLTNDSRVLVPFFAAASRGPGGGPRLVLLTKSDAVENLIGLEHGGRTSVAWSLNPGRVAAAYEREAPSPAARLRAARRVARAGYPVRYQIMPIVPIPGWREAYAQLVERAWRAARPERITLGGLCSFPAARGLLRAQVPRNAAIRRALDRGEIGPDGRLRYARPVRMELYRHIVATIRALDPRASIALCLEERAVWRAVGLDPRRARCTCPP